MKPRRLVEEVCADDAEVSIDGNTVNVKLASMPAGSKVVLEYKAVAQAAGEHDNVATLKGGNYFGDDVRAEAKVNAVPVLERDARDDLLVVTGDMLPIEVLALMLLGTSGSVAALIARRKSTKKN